MKTERKKNTPAKKTIAKSAAAPKLTPSQREEIQTRAPLVKMIKEGKDRAEATLLFVMMRIVDGINYELDDSYYERELDQEKKARRASLRHNADEALKFLVDREADIGKLHPQAAYYDPTFAEYWQALRHKAFNLQRLIVDMRDAADWLLTPRRKVPRDCPFTKSGLKKHINAVEELIKELTEEKLQLFLVIGFCLGLRSHRKKIQDTFDPIKLDLIKNFTIAKPASEAKTDLFVQHRFFHKIKR